MPEVRSLAGTGILDDIPLTSLLAAQWKHFKEDESHHISPEVIELPVRLSTSAGSVVRHAELDTLGRTSGLQH